MANNKDNNISDLSGVSRQDKPRYNDTQYTPISSADDISNDDSTCCSLDAPLDFSVKRRREDEELGPPRSGRLEGAHGRVKSEPEVVVKSEASSTPPRSRANGLSPATNGIKSLSTDRYPAKIGEPPLALPGALPGGLMPGGGVGMFPIFPTALLNGLPAGQDISVDTKGENGRSSKSAKDYGKDSLRLASPTGLPLYNVDLAAAQAMAMNSEEMFSQYRTYIMALQDQMKLQTSPGGSSSTSSASQGPSPADLYSDGHHEPTLSRRQSPSTSESGGAPIPGPTVAGLPSSSRALYGRPTTTHSRRRGRTLPEDQKDELYWERRRKNNEAAKRSRDARRAKEDEIAIRAAFLEQENLKLRVEVAALKNETAKLRCMLYNS